jgi:hypothetical protein
MRAKLKDNSNDNSNKVNLENDDLDIRGRPKKTVVSFQCDLKIWNHFDDIVESEWGKYKKSLIIEDLIRKYIESKKNKKSLFK